MYYFKDKWNLIDLTIVALSVIDVIVDLVTEGATGSFSPGVLKLAKIFKILRMGRLLKLMKVGAFRILLLNFLCFAFLYFLIIIDVLYMCATKIIVEV